MPVLAEIARRDDAVIIADRGYTGLDKSVEARVITPFKRGGNTDLTMSQKRKNTKISKKRIIIEHVIGEMKQFEVINGPHEGTPEEINADINLVAGIVNLKRMDQKWDPMCERLLRRKGA